MDEEGVELEVAALSAEPERDFVVFHAAEMRGEYGHLLARAERWRA